MPRRRRESESEEVPIPVPETGEEPEIRQPDRPLPSDHELNVDGQDEDATRREDRG